MTRASDLSPIALALGQDGQRLLALAGWITDMPDGPGANLLLHPLGHGVADRMKRLAEILGLEAAGPATPMRDVPPDTAYVAVDVETNEAWLHYGIAAWMNRPVSADWIDAARTRHTVALWLGVDGGTIRTTKDADKYMDRAARRDRIHGGLVRVMAPNQNE